jgi:hypothetical protein
MWVDQSPVFDDQKLLSAHRWELYFLPQAFKIDSYFIVGIPTNFFEGVDLNDFSS